jgi:hypothetical protein
MTAFTKLALATVVLIVASTLANAEPKTKKYPLAVAADLILRGVASDGRCGTLGQYMFWKEKTGADVEQVSSNGTLYLWTKGREYKELTAAIAEAGGRILVEISQEGEKAWCKRYRATLFDTASEDWK